MTTKAIIYTRVSTDDQKDNGFSLQDQEGRLRKYCQQNGIEIIRHYQDDHSAKNFNRPAFQQFLGELKAKAIKPDLFLCVRPDRFSRNMMESWNMLQTLTSYGVKFQTLENHTDLNSPEALIPFMLNMLLPQVDNERRSLNTISGMRQAAREGRWIWRAPIGYRNDSANKAIVVNEAVAPLVVEAFELYGMGVYAAEEVRLMMRKKGLVCSKNNFLNMLENPFYTGKYVLEPWKDQPEEMIQGNHEPLISDQLFATVQDLRHGKKRQQVSVSATRREELELRGFLQCKCCGSKLTGSASRSRNGVRHFYYHCQHGCKERFRSDTANQDFIKFLSGMTPPKEVIELYQMILRDRFGTDMAKKEVETNKIESQIKLLEQRISALTDKYVDGYIDGDLYVQKHAAYKTEITLLTDSLRMLELQEDSFTKYLAYGCTLLSNLPKYYEQSPLAVQQKIVGSIFPGKLIYDDGKYRTTETNFFIELMRSFPVDNKGKKEGQTMLLHNLPTWAPEAGLEPATL
ncbi:recombinase family protein [Spirosoma flavus]